MCIKFKFNNYVIFLYKIYTFLYIFYKRYKKGFFLLKLCKKKTVEYYKGKRVYITITFYKIVLALVLLLCEYVLKEAISSADNLCHEFYH